MTNAVAKPSANDAIAALRGAVVDYRNEIPRFIGGFYGEPGAGKTVQLARLAHLITPVGKKIIIVDTSDGTVSLMNHPKDTLPDGRVVNLLDLDVVIPFRFEDLTQLSALSAAIKAGVAPFDNVGTIAFDEMTTIARHQVLTVATGREMKGKSELVEGAIDLADYNIAQNYLTRMLGKFKAQPGLNILINAHAKVKKENKLEVTRPSYAAGIGEAVLGFMHSCGFMYNTVDQTPSGPRYTRGVQIAPTITHPYCKSRVGGFKSLRVDPDEYLRTVQRWLNSGAKEQEQATEELTANNDFGGFVVTED